MKLKSLLTFVFILGCLIGYAQVNKQDITRTKEDSTIIPDTPPQFPGGPMARNAFLAKHIHYPESELENGIQGKVVIRFSVEKNGKITEIKVTESVSKNIDKEAIRVIRKMPRWKPGISKGEAVKAIVVLPIRFSLN